jgi:hypothetical protein
VKEGDIVIRGRAGWWAANVGRVGAGGKRRDLSEAIERNSGSR